MRIGIIGCGFWAGYQVAAWREADPRVQFAFCDRVAEAAQALAARFGPAPWYADAEAMLNAEATRTWWISSAVPIPTRRLPS